MATQMRAAHDRVLPCRGQPPKNMAETHRPPLSQCCRCEIYIVNWSSRKCWNRRPKTTEKFQLPDCEVVDSRRLFWTSLNPFALPTATVQSWPLKTKNHMRETVQFCCWSLPVWQETSLIKPRQGRQEKVAARNLVSHKLENKELSTSWPLTYLITCGCYLRSLNPETRNKKYM